MVWQQAGPVVQVELMDRILGFSKDARSELKPLIIPVLRHVLSTELSGTSWDFNSATLQSEVRYPPLTYSLSYGATL